MERMDDQPWEPNRGVSSRSEDSSSPPDFGSFFQYRQVFGKPKRQTTGGGRENLGLDLTMRGDDRGEGRTIVEMGGRSVISMIGEIRIAAVQTSSEQKLRRVRFRSRPLFAVL